MLLRQRLMGIALAGSLLIHAVCALLIPPFSKRPTLEPVETLSFARIHRIEIIRHDLPARHVPAKPTRVARVTLTQKLPSTRPQPAQPRPVAVSVRSSIVAINHAPPGNPSTGSAVGTTTQASPQPQATPAPDVRETAPQTQPVAGGYMPFGADEPDPVLDPKSLRQLQALGVHVTLVVTVGDDGKTKRVDFHPPLDPQLEAQVRAVLVAANWDPAYCGGGIPCQKDTNITL
jgi:hypothetical protein